MVTPDSNGHVPLASSVTTVPNKTFQNCGSLKSISGSDTLGAIPPVHGAVARQLSHAIIVTWSAETNGYWGDWGSWQGGVVGDATHLVVSGPSTMIVANDHYSHAHRLQVRTGFVDTARLCIGEACDSSA